MIWTNPVKKGFTHILASVNLKSVKKQINQKVFARNVDRDRIKPCENLDMDLMEFIEPSVPAMKEVHEDLNL